MTAGRRRSRVSVGGGSDASYYKAMAGPGILLTIALLFGGGGSGFPATEMLVELTGVIVLLSELWQFQWSGLGRTAKVGLALLLLTVLLPLAQLVPLPPIIWQNLPGRGFVRDAANVLGSGGAYLPISLDPDMTLRSEFALIPAVAMTLAAFRLSSEGIRHLLFLMMAIAMASVILSSLQIAMGPTGTAYLYITSHEGLATGFFANRNHQGSFLDVTYLCAAALAARSNGRHRGRFSVERILLFAMMGVCLLGTLATASRTASAVALVAVALTIPWFFQVRVRIKPQVVIASVAVLALALAALYFSSGFQFLLKRYQASDDARAHFWPDVVYAIGVFFPAGSGLGTFDPVFRSIEQLSIVGPLYVNDAHNDFMQVALETGVLGLLLLVTFVAYLGRIAYLSRQRSMGSSAKVMLQSALYGILVFALHSVTDYPLRTLALETVLGLFFGRVMAGTESRESQRGGGKRAFVNTAPQHLAEQDMVGT